MTGVLLVLADQDYDHMDWGGGWWIVMALGMVLFWGLVILGVVWLVRTVSPGHAAGSGQAPNPIELLDRRLAEGDISTEEYAQRRAVLEGRTGREPPV